METRTLEFKEATEAQRKAMGNPLCLALAGRNWQRWACALKLSGPQSGACRSLRTV